MRRLSSSTFSNDFSRPNLFIFHIQHLRVGGTNICVFSGGFRGGSRGSLEPPSGAKLSNFHGQFQKMLCKIRQSNPPFVHLNPLFRNPGSATGFYFDRIRTLVAMAT